MALTPAEVLGIVANAGRIAAKVITVVWTGLKHSRIACEIGSISKEPGVPELTVVFARILLSRRRRWSPVPDIKDCRLRIAWRSARGQAKEHGVEGIWWEGRSEKTLSEGNPLYLIPLLLALDRPDRKLSAHTAYVMDPLFFREAPLEMLTVILPGEYWFEIQLLSGARREASFRFLLSVSSVGRFIAIEPTMAEGRGGRVFVQW